MSAIAGIVRLDGAPADRANLERMLERLAHRGPDGHGSHIADSCGLGHRMLWTTPESLHERLPLTDSTGDLTLTADARIDNREELCSLLSAPSTVTDADLILQAYARWGERCPEHLLGDFAFALWDARRRLLFCARDHFGVKPFYYHHRPGRLFAFASEIKGLLVLSEVPRRLNETRVADYLVPLLEDKEITFYEEIVRLPPAHHMTVSRDGVRIEQYWALDPEREIRMKSDGEYAAAFREIFTEAVRCRLRSAFPVGSMLSGGLDSSSIVCVARKLLAEDGGGKLHTFSAIFPDVPECDEREYIEAVLGGHGVKPHFVRADQLSPLADLKKVLFHEDEPFYAPNLFLHWAIYQSSQRESIRVILDGIDGDTTVSHGIEHLTDLARSGQWRAAFKEATGLARNFQTSRFRTLFRYCIKPLVPEPTRSILRGLRSVTASGEQPRGVIDRHFAERIGLAERARRLDGTRIPTRPREQHWRAMTRGLIPFYLEVADRAAAAFHIEARYPFFDCRLARFCLALPPEQKLRDGWTRVALRSAMAPLLPAAIHRRGGKSNLGPNFTRALRTFERQRLDDATSTKSGILGPFVDVHAFGRAHDRFLTSEGTQEAMTLWRAITLAAWLSSNPLKQGGNDGAPGHGI